MNLKIVTKTMWTCLYLTAKLNLTQAESVCQARVWIICPIRERRRPREASFTHSSAAVMSVWNAHEDHGDDDDSNCKLTFAFCAEFLCGFPKAIQDAIKFLMYFMRQTKKHMAWTPITAFIIWRRKWVPLVSTSGKSAVVVLHTFFSATITNVLKLPL